MQGVDYAYTLQGWLKGVNSATGASYYDMGLDSATVAKDAYGYSLGYYPNDYTPIGGSGYHAFTLQYSQTTGDITGQSLYNGNISNSTLAVNDLNSGSPVGYTYHYDQLNRLKKMRQYAGIHGTSWGRSNITLNYQENATYDGNGNILTYGRNGVYPTTAQTIDSLTYNYNYTDGRLVNNKLNYLHDAVAGSGYNLDLRNQTSTTNYQYDAIGNLIADAYSGITGIGWTVYNKPDTIYKAAGNITYTYNTANERVSQTVNGVTTWYIRDAQGNVLAIYNNAHSAVNWMEQHLYGSGRLGIWLPDINIATGNALNKWDSVGFKRIELDNHLGNVLATITDKRIQNGSPLSYFTADIASAQDYYPFGMLEPGREYTFGSDSTYRYGFNGKENDNAVKGLGNWQDYGSRDYEGRVGRFWSVDLLSYKFPWYTPYQFAGNTPVQAIDKDGLEPAKPEKGKKNLLIVVQGWTRENPTINNTQTKNAMKEHEDMASDDALGTLESTLPNTDKDLQVVTFASSTFRNTKTDVAKTIQMFRKENPEGKIIAVGHSLGAVNILDLLQDHRDIAVDLLITLDPHSTDAIFNNAFTDNDVFSNVKNSINYHQTVSFTGMTLDYKSTSTSGVNIEVKNTSHRQIDNDLIDLNIIQNDILNFLNGRQVVEDAKSKGTIVVPKKKP